MQADIIAEDRGESPSLMDPLLIGEGSRHGGPLTDLALDLTRKSAGFRRSQRPSLMASHADIERALQNDYSQDARKRDLQHEAKAHIAVQKWIEGEPQRRPCHQSRRNPRNSTALL